MVSEDCVMENHESRITNHARGVCGGPSAGAVAHLPPPPKQPLGCLSGDELWAIVEEKMNLPRVETPGGEKS
jgi:hypothetical protein